MIFYYLNFCFLEKVKNNQKNYRNIDLSLKTIEHRNYSIRHSKIKGGINLDNKRINLI